jgi:hypothetical protein
MVLASEAKHKPEMVRQGIWTGQMEKKWHKGERERKNGISKIVSYADLL